MRAGTIKSSEMEWLHSQSQKMQIQLEPRRTRSGINYDVYMSDEDTEDDNSTNDEDTEDDSDTSNENTYTSDGDHDTSDEDTNTSVDDINISDGDTEPSDEIIEIGSVNEEDTDMNDEIIEINNLSDEVGSVIDLTAEDTDEDDFQASDEPTPSGQPIDIDTTPESWLEEWPEQSPARADLADMQRYQAKDQEFHMPARRHNQTFRENKYGKPSVHEILVVWIFVEAFDRHFWLPSAFDHPRGRPYEIVCQRVWDAWHRTRRRYDSFTDVVASIEKGGEHDWPNVTPEMLQFPKHRVRHRKRNPVDS